MEAATTRLYEATLKGEISSFLKLLEEDPLVLNRCMIGNSGRLFVQSPLHVAAEMGHSEIVTKLIDVNPTMCLAHDVDGKTPIHVAAAKGHVNIVQVLHRANPHAAQEMTYNGDTILHLCVKHNQLEALKMLLRLSNDDGNQLINSKDKNGNTVLHLAVTSKQTQVVEYLSRRPKIFKNAMNIHKMTAVDIYLKQNEQGFEDRKMEQYLKRVKRAKDVLSGEAEEAWLEKQRSALMVVASLIATMAFQAGINPPGGYYGESKKENGKDLIAGEAIWSYYKSYRNVLISNTIGLISSLSVIMLLISGLPLKRYLLTLLRAILWISVTATSYTYFVAIGFVTSSYFKRNYKTYVHAALNSILTWTGLMAVIFLGNAMQFTKKMMGWQKRLVIKNNCKKHCYCCVTTSSDNNAIAAAAAKNHGSSNNNGRGLDNA